MQAPTYYKIVLYICLLKYVVQYVVLKKIQFKTFQSFYK